MPLNDGGIDWLKSRLYSRTNPPQARARRTLHEEAYETPEQWQQPREEGVRMRRPVHHESSGNKLVRSLFIGSVAFFLLSVGVALLMMFTGGNTVSAENIEIDIAGPLAIAGGEELTLQIEVTNRNAVPIKLADLIIEYPDGTREAGDLNKDLTRVRETIGTIEPGGKTKTTAKAVLYGSEDTPREVRVTVEYRIDGSNAIFYKEKKHTVILSSSPVAIGVEMVKEISSGQEIAADVRIVSNATEVLQDVVFTAEFPYGFELTSAEPKQSGGDSTWLIGDIAPETERTIRIKGIMTGEQSSERIFRFNAGSARPDNPTIIAATFESVEIPVKIKQPFMGLKVAVDGEASTGEAVAARGEPIRFDIEWQNNLTVPIYDAEIVVKLGGNAFDRTRVEAPNGFYRSQSSDIIWTGENIASLSRVEPGQKGTASFTLHSVSLSADPSLPDATIGISASVKGRRVSESNVPETLESTAERSVRLASSLNLNTRSVYSVGPFENTGPLPPRAEEETTYTIIFTVANSSNEIKDARVVARLPSYVKWMDQVSPGDAKLSYNPVGGEVVWNIGNIPARTGYGVPAKEVAFRVSLEPSLSQVGTMVTLVREQKLTGLDSFANTMLETTRRELTTRLTTDPNAPGGHDTVVE